MRLTPPEGFHSLDNAAVQALATEVSEQTALRQERHAFKQIVERQVPAVNGEDKNEKEARQRIVKAVVDGCVGRADSLRATVRRGLSTGKYLDPLEIAGRYETLVSTPLDVSQNLTELAVAIQGATNNRIMLRSLVEHSKNFLSLPAYENRRQVVATMFHQLGLFAPEGYEAKVLMGVPELAFAEYLPPSELARRQADTGLPYVDNKFPTTAAFEVHWDKIPAAEIAA